MGHLTYNNGNKALEVFRGRKYFQTSDIWLLRFGSWKEQIEIYEKNSENHSQSHSESYYWTHLKFHSESHLENHIESNLESYLKSFL